MIIASVRLGPHERNEVFERDPAATAKAWQALDLVRSGQITRERFHRLIANFKGEALARHHRR